MGKLFWKFLAFLFLAQATTLMLTGAFFWVNHQREITENFGLEKSRPASDLIQAAAETLTFGGTDALESLLKSWQKRPMPQVYAVDSKGIEILLRSVPLDILQAAKKLSVSEDSEKFAKNIQLENGQSYLIFVPDLGQRSHLEPPLDFPHSPNDEHVMPPPNQSPPDRHSPFPRLPFVTMVAGLLVSLLFAILIAWYFSKPIKHLRNALMQAANGQLSIRIGGAMNHRRDELADLGRAFDAMAGRLESLIQGQRRLLHHVSHELRSPLARIQIAIGLAKQSREKIDTSLDRIQIDSDRMNALIGELLQLSKLESGATALKKEKVELSHLLKNLVADASYEASEHNIVLKHTVQSNLIMEGDAELLYRAVENIVRNAIKYSDSDSEVSIGLFKSQSQKMVRLSVSDEGNGVPESELDAIFQPFMRSSHAKSKDGYGVGLAIAKQIIEAHGGKIKATNLKPKGFQIQIDLPTS